MVKLWWIKGIRQFPENQKQEKYLFHNSIGTWTHGYFTWKLDLFFVSGWIDKKRYDAWNAFHQETQT